MNGHRSVNGCDLCARISQFRAGWLGPTFARVAFTGESRALFAPPPASRRGRRSLAAIWQCRPRVPPFTRVAFTGRSGGCLPTGRNRDVSDLAAWPYFAAVWPIAVARLGEVVSYSGQIDPSKKREVPKAQGCAHPSDNLAFAKSRFPKLRYSCLEKAIFDEAHRRSAGQRLGGPRPQRLLARRIIPAACHNRCFLVCRTRPIRSFATCVGRCDRRGQHRESN